MKTGIRILVVIDDARGNRIEPVGRAIRWIETGDGITARKDPDVDLPLDSVGMASICRAEAAIAVTEIFEKHD